MATHGSERQGSSTGQAGPEWEGIVTKNVDPMPGSDDTQIFPVVLGDPPADG